MNEVDYECLEAKDEEMTDCDNQLFDRWSEYPENLDARDYPSVDLHESCTNLRNDEVRLCDKSTNVRTLWATEAVNVEHGTLKNADDLAEFMIKTQQAVNGPQCMFFSISPKMSIGKLQVTSDVLRKLLTVLNVHPEFLDVLHAFGSTIDRENEGFSFFKEHVTQDHEQVSYTIRYIEKRVENGKTEWKLRKSGIFCSRQEEETAWIFLHPQEFLWDRIHQVAGGRKCNPLDIHRMIIETSTRNWTPYLNDLENQFQEMNEKVFLWRPDTIPHEEEAEGPEFADAQRIQRFTDSLHKLAHNLSINQGAMVSLQGSIRRSVPQERVSEYERVLDLLIRQAKQQRARVDSLLQRTAGVAALIPHVLARQENRIMLRLSEKAADNASAMKVVTIITMLYLPSSLVAAFFSIALISWSPGEQLKAAPQLYYFFIAAGTLTVVTFVIWKAWDYHQRQREKPDFKDLEKAITESSSKPENLVSVYSAGNLQSPVRLPGSPVRCTRKCREWVSQKLAQMPLKAKPNESTIHCKQIVDSDSSQSSTSSNELEGAEEFL